MSFASGFSGFAAGLGGAVQETRARKDRNAAMAQNNQMLEMMAAQGGMGLGGAALGGAGLGAASTGGATPAAPAKPQGRITQMLSKVRETGEELGGALGLRETDGEPTTGLGRALARVRDTGHAWGEALGLREPDAPPIQFDPNMVNSFLPQGGAAPEPRLSYGRAAPGYSDEDDAFARSLSTSESGGNWNALNSAPGAGGVGHGGRQQFGTARLIDAANAGIIPRMTPQQFAKAKPDVQRRVERWHRADMDSQIAKRGLDQYEGQIVGGVPITREAIYAMAHLGGMGGAARFLKSDGRSNPQDGNGTSLLDYARRHGGHPTFVAGRGIPARPRS